MDIEYEVYDQFHRPPVVMEENDGKSIVEMAGYIPAHIQIQQMMEAGERLNRSRRDQYDYASEEEDDGRIDPTRDSNFDLSDASRILNDVDSKITAAKQELADAEAKAKAEQLAAAEADRLELEKLRSAALAEKGLREGKA